MNVRWYHWRRVHKDSRREIYMGFDGEGNTVFLEFLDMGRFRPAYESEIGQDASLREAIMPEKHIRVSGMKIRGTCVYADPDERKFYLKDGNSFKAVGDLYRKLIEEELEG